MFCSKCGEKNEEGSKFCKGCGAILGDVGAKASSAVPKSVGATKESFNFFTYLLGILFKPFTSFKKNEKELSETKNSFILGAIATGLMALVLILSTVIVVAKITDWQGLKYIKWFDVILKNLALYACVILAIPGIFYLGGLVIKKQLSYTKFLSITSTAFVPYAIIQFAAAILGLIWSPLGVIAQFLGFIYLASILCTLMDSELKLEKEERIYFYTVCFTVLLSVIYFVSTETDLMTSSMFSLF